MHPLIPLVAVAEQWLSVVATVQNMLLLLAVATYTKPFLCVCLCGDFFFYCASRSQFSSFVIIVKVRYFHDLSFDLPHMHARSKKSKLSYVFILFMCSVCN